MKLPILKIYSKGLSRSVIVFNKKEIVMKISIKKHGANFVIVGMLFCCTSVFASTSVEQQITQISSADAIQTIYASSSNSASRITILGYLPGVISRFKVNPSQSAPAWLNTMLSQSLNSSNSAEVIAAINQIGTLNVTSLSTNLIGMYGKSNNININVNLIKALGDMGNQSAMSLLQSIIDAQVVSPVTDQAIISARKLCASTLIPDISAYCTNLNSQIQNGAFSDTINRPLMDPDVALMDAKGLLQILMNGACGQ